MRQSPTSPLNALVQEAGRKLASLHMTEIRGAGDAHDAANLNDDIDQVCKIVDGLILEIGKYAQEHIGPVDLGLFTEQLAGALQGNATFEIESVGKQASDWMDHSDRHFRRTFAQAAE